MTPVSTLHDLARTWRKSILGQLAYVLDQASVTGPGSANSFRQNGAGGRQEKWRSTPHRPGRRAAGDGAGRRQPLGGKP